MKFILLTRALSAFILSSIIISCNNEEKVANEKNTEPGIKTENVSYSSDTVTMNGFVAYDSSSKTKRPIVLIIHEWWGLNDYTKQRARQIAELGYVAFAVDMFGAGKTAGDPTGAMALAGPFYENLDMAKSRFSAASRKQN